MFQIKIKKWNYLPWMCLRIIRFHKTFPLLRSWLLFLLASLNFIILRLSIFLIRFTAKSGNLLHTSSMLKAKISIAILCSFTFWNWLLMILLTRLADGNCFNLLIPCTHCSKLKKVHNETVRRMNSDFYKMGFRNEIYRVRGMSWNYFQRLS